MKKIKFLLVNFNNELSPKMVPAFRGAIIEKVDRSHILFHHHNGDKAVLYKYPLIQYKSIRKQAGIVCLGDGVGEMYRLFSQPSLDIKLHDTKITLEIINLEMRTFELGMTQTLQNYRLVNWLGLNEANFKEFQKLTSIKDKIYLLEKTLIGNILSFAKGVEFSIEEVEKEERGTDIILHIDSESKEFLEKSKIDELLKKYCKFLPVSIAFGKRTEWKDGKEVDTEEGDTTNESEDTGDDEVDTEEEDTTAAGGTCCCCC